MRTAALACAIPLAFASLSVPALGQNLVANPVLTRDLPPPGWLADRRAQWVADHPVYRASCRTPDVAAEIEFLNRVVGRDEMLLNLAGNPPQDDPALARQAQLAKKEMGMLRNDIAAADGLAAQLKGVPACAPAAAPPPTPAPAEPTKAEAAVPPPAPEAPAKAAEAAPPPTPGPQPQPARTPPPATPAAAGTVTLRYDDKVAALTPRSVRAFDQAVAAARAGKPVRLAIDGCAAGADFSVGSVCGERLRSLTAMLQRNGVRNPKRLFADAP